MAVANHLNKNIGTVANKMCPKIFALTSDIDDEMVSNYKKLGFTNTCKYPD